MQLYILRHGKAESSAATDFSRPLRQRGEQQIHRVANKYLADEDSDAIHFDAIWSSPLLRAQQTAIIAREYLVNAPVIQSSELIRPESSLQTFGDYLESQSINSLLIVSHQTFVGRLIDFITDTPGLGYDMGTGCLAKLEFFTFAKGCGDLKWLKAP